MRISLARSSWLIFAIVLAVGLVFSGLWIVQSRETQGAENSGAVAENSGGVAAPLGCAGAQIGVLAASRSTQSMHIRQAVPPAAAAPNITGAAACSKVEQSLGGADATSTQVELSLYSDDVFGATNGKNPKYQNVLAWVVTFKGGNCIAMGAPGEFGPSTLVTAVDAVTGEILNAHYECPPA